MEVPRCGISAVRPATAIEGHCMKRQFCQCSEGHQELLRSSYGNSLKLFDERRWETSASATTGDEFRLSNGQWIFNLDTKATQMTQGIWLLEAILSDDSQHSAWIQLK